MGRLREKQLLKAMFPPMGYESVADVQPTWHVTARAPREYPGATLDDLLGFWGLFESDFGDARTPLPYWRVTPSQSPMYASLPFRCPHCSQVVTEFQDPSERSAYVDAREGHGNYWCPKCSKRYYMNFGGPVFTGALAPQEAAPSKVEQFRVDRPTEVSRSFMQDERGPGLGKTYAMGLDALGAALDMKKKKIVVTQGNRSGAAGTSKPAGGVVRPAGGAIGPTGGVHVNVTKPAGGAVRPAGGAIGPTGGAISDRFKLTPAQAQAQVDAARAKLKISAQKSAKSAQNLKSRAGAKKGGAATTKIANRALTVANKAAAAAQKLLALASKKLTPKAKAATKPGGAAGKTGVTKSTTVTSKTGVSKTYMRGLDVLGDGVYIGDDLSDARQDLAFAQQAFKEAKAAADQVASALATARQAYDEANSSPPDQYLHPSGPGAGVSSANPAYAAWVSNVDDKEKAYKDALSTAMGLIFNDTTLGDAAGALDDASALVAYLEGLPPPPPIPDPTPTPPVDGGTTGDGGSGSGGGGGGGSGGGSDGSGEGAEDQGAAEDGQAPSADESVQRFRESGGAWDPFEEEGQGEGGGDGTGDEEPMEVETMSDAATTEEETPTAEIDDTDENAVKTADDVLGEVLKEALDIVEEYQHQITDESPDVERTHGSAHRGSAYLQQITQAPHGSSAGTEGGSMRPEETIEVFGAGAHRGLFDPHSKFNPRDVVFHNGEYWVAMQNIAPPWYSSTVRSAHMPGRGTGWRRLTGSATPIRGEDAEVETVEDEALGSAYARGLDALGAGVSKKPSPNSAAHHAQIAAAQTKVKKSASAAEKAIATAVTNHAKHPPRTHAGAVKAAQVASARAALIGKRLAKRVGVTKIVGEALDEVAGAVKPSPKRAQAMDKLRAAAKSVGVSSKHVAEAAKAHATARAQVNAKAAAKQKSLKQTKVFKKKAAK